MLLKLTFNRFSTFSDAPWTKWVCTNTSCLSSLGNCGSVRKFNQTVNTSDRNPLGKIHQLTRFSLKLEGNGPHWISEDYAIVFRGNSFCIQYTISKFKCIAMTSLCMLVLNHPHCWPLSYCSTFHIVSILRPRFPVRNMCTLVQIWCYLLPLRRSWRSACAHIKLGKAYERTACPRIAMFRSKAISQKRHINVKSVSFSLIR